MKQQQNQVYNSDEFQKKFSRQENFQRQGLLVFSENGELCNNNNV